MKQILYIDDDQEMIDLVRLILSRKGYEVIGFRSAREGIKSMVENVPDLVLLDLMVPDLNGWDIFKQIKANQKLTKIPVIVITAKTSSIDKVLGLQLAKVDGYITKPFSQGELVERVMSVLNKYNQNSTHRN